MKNKSKFEYPEWIKVGQKIIEKDYEGRLFCRAIITEITIRGFKYKYDEPKVVVPRLGMIFEGGECFLDELEKIGIEPGWTPIYENYQI